MQQLSIIRRMKRQPASGEAIVVATSVLGEQRVLLQDVSWQLFEHLLTELCETRSARLIYDRGLLEIMTPPMRHEHNNRLIEKLIDILVEELNLNILSVGSMTCKREDLGRGPEPDSSFYIQNEPLMRSKATVNLSKDPPPDLVVEVEYSSSAIDKLNLSQWAYRSSGDTMAIRYASTSFRKDATFPVKIAQRLLPFKRRTFHAF